MDCKTLELVLVDSGSILIPVGIAYVNWSLKSKKGKKESDRILFQTYFNCNYEQLFEEQKYRNKAVTTGDEICISTTEDFNVPYILSFCDKIDEFTKKGNQFKINQINKKIKTLKKVCGSITELTDSPTFPLENIDDDSGYERIYLENKNRFELFREEFIACYKLIFDTY